MSETSPVPPDAERPAGPKPPSRIVWFLCGIIVAVMAYLLFAPIIGLLLSPGVPHAGTLNVMAIRGMRAAILDYAKDNDGSLPPTLWALVPKYVSETGSPPFRYANTVTRERFDWLYFPHGKLDGLPPDTILLATPGSPVGPSHSQQRLVCKVGGVIAYILEADFQRLIREQNPPAASSSPDR